MLIDGIYYTEPELSCKFRQMQARIEQLESENEHLIIEGAKLRTENEELITELDRLYPIIQRGQALADEVFGIRNQVNRLYDKFIYSK